MFTQDADYANHGGDTGAVFACLRTTAPTKSRTDAIPQTEQSSVALRASAVPNRSLVKSEIYVIGRVSLALRYQRASVPVVTSITRFGRYQLGGRLLLGGIRTH